jgi:hypothetical protein
MTSTFRRMHYRLGSIGFLILIPVMTFYVIRAHVSMVVLAICIPVYVLLSRSFYSLSKRV